MGDFLPRMPVNHHAKFDAASFILGGEIRNHTKTRTQTNSPHFAAYLRVWIKRDKTE